VPILAGFDAEADMCEMKLQLSNGIFGYGLFGFLFLNNLITLCRFHSVRRNYPEGQRNDALSRNTMQNYIHTAVWYFFVFGSFFFFMQIAWRNVSPACFQGWNIWFFINFIISMAMTGPAALCLGCFLLYTPCCLGEICRSVVPPLRQLYFHGNMDGFEGEANNQENNAMTNALLSNLNSKKFDGGAMTECCICLEEFKDDDEVVPLPCNSNHYFHEACISEHIKTKGQCPLCRAEITAEMLA